MTPEPGHKKRQHTFKLFLNYINESVVSTQLIENNCIVNLGFQLPFFPIWSHMHARAHACISIYLDMYLFLFYFYFILFFFIFFFILLLFFF